MNTSGKAKSLAILSLVLSTSVFAAVSPPASDAATKLFCDAKAAGNPISQQAAAQQAATNLGVPGGTQVLVNIACDGRSFAEYSRGVNAAGGSASAGGAAAGGAGATAGFTVSSAAIIVGGVVLAAAAVSGGGGGGDDTNTSP